MKNLKILIVELVILYLCQTLTYAELNDTNILRIGRNKIEIKQLNTDNNNNSNKEEIKKFKKNSNIEQDWQVVLKKLAEKEERTKKYDLNFMITKLNKSANSIKWFQDFYDPLKWLKIPGEPNDNCKKDLEYFLDELKNGKLWAAKLSDASGRYSSQYYFGNGFWLGSNTLCREINTTDTRTNVKTANETLPFFVKFYVARMLFVLPKELESSARQVFLGLCMPSTCDRTSVNSILRASADRVEREGESSHRSEGPRIHIVQLRSVPSTDYSPWEDSRFHFLVFITGIVCLLMLFAVIYDYHNLSVIKDTDSLSVSNNNEQRSKFVNKHLDEHSISINHHDKELIEKIDNGTPKSKKINIKNHDNHDDEDDDDDRGILVKCLLAFNPISNGSKIVNTEPAAKSNLTCLHGLRVMSLAWVVLVHTYLQVFSIAENKSLRAVTERNIMFQTVSNATFSVDTFFFISGLLMTILFYRSLGKSNILKGNYLINSSRKFLVMILYRFIRLTPSYLVVLLLNAIFMKYAMSTTVFSPQIIDHITCEKYWWRNILYINSLYPRTEMCMLWSWYMANDMQFYIIGILLLLLSVKYFKASLIIGSILILLSYLTTFTIAYSNDYVARIQEPFALFDELYDKPWLRAGPFFIGTLTGYILYKTNGVIRLPTVIKGLGWLLSTILMLSLVYGLYPANLTVLTSSMYASLGHTAWAISVGFIVIQCCTGSAPLIDKFLSLKIIYPLSRLTYCAYLVHPMIMMFISTRMDGSLHLHNGVVHIIYFGNMVIAYLVAFCISIAFEAPVINLLKIALGSKGRPR